MWAITINNRKPGGKGQATGKDLYGSAGRFSLPIVSFCNAVLRLTLKDGRPAVISTQFFLGFPAKRIDQDLFGLFSMLLVVAIHAAPPGRLPEADPVGRAIARALKPRSVHKGFQ